MKIQPNIDPKSLLWPSWALLGASWALLGASWRRLGASWCILGRLGPSRRRLVGVLGRLESVLWASWGRLGGVLARKTTQHKPDSIRNGKRRFFSNGFFGSLWLSVALCGSLFFPMALCESLWLSVALGGSLWPSVYRSCSIWPPKSTLKPSKIIPKTVQNPPQNAPKSRSGGDCASDRFWNPFFPASWGVLGRLVRLLGPPWGVLGASWECLGASWARLGAS